MMMYSSRVERYNILLMEVGGTIMKTSFCFAFVFSCFSCLFNGELSRLSQTQVGLNGLTFQSYDFKETAQRNRKLLNLCQSCPTRHLASLKHPCGH